VTLVGVLSADLGLDLPDFRAAEKTFARLLQVSGRSGRGIDPGEVIVQTYYTDSDVIRYAAAQDYRSFFDSEIRSREAASFPPFCRLVRVVMSAKDAHVLGDEIDRFTSRLNALCKEHRIRIDILGPAPCPVGRLRGLNRRHLIVRLDNPFRLTRLLTAWENREARFGLPAKVKVAVDVDPDDMM
jgi:primosomal protein N' (replication factor Y)